MGQPRWERLYERHADEVLAYARRRVGVEDASDVVADTFLIAWRRIGDIPEDGLPWLFGVARNVVEHSRRSARRRQALHSRLAAVSTGEPDPDHALEVEVRTDIIAAMEMLPPQEREALMLIAWEDLDKHRGAAVVGCSPGTFAVRVHRGRRHLRKILSSSTIEHGVSLGPYTDEAAGGERS